MLTAHVVAHTHWDREWYHPFVRFRQRLVALVDELLSEPPSASESFLLDGQAIVVEDYLEVRPERAAEVSSLLHSGRLEAGPWYVLADELIPSGEAIVRNLLLGRRVLRRLRASSPPVLYCPDSFGHPAALPSIAAGFGLPITILWRGFGGARWPAVDTVRWTAASGDAVVLYHLPPNGYEYGWDLPLSASHAEARWSRMRDELSPRSATSVVLVPNGADHHARQPRQRDAVRTLKSAARHMGDTVRASSLTAFAKHVLAATAAWTLTEITGELRDSYGYTWTLQGTFASRAAQKRQNAHAERMLVRDAEPWAALVRFRGGTSRLPLLNAAWKSLLQAHPHDTLCGCSVDAVAEAMDLRVADAISQAIGIREDCIADLIAHDAVGARAAREKWSPIVVLRNRAPRPRGGVAMIEIKEFLAHVPVGPGSASADTRRAARTSRPTAGGARPLQILSRRVGYDQIESPRHYPDKDLVAITRAAVWVDTVPGYGLAALRLGGKPTSGGNTPRAVVGRDLQLDNGSVRLVVGTDGRVSLDDLGSGRRIDDLLVIEDSIDRGDLYTPSIRGLGATAEFVGAALVHSGPFLGEIHLRWQLKRRNAHRRPRASRLDIRLRLTAESPLVRIAIDGMNRARDHRLRIGIRTDARDAAVWADAAFGPVHRLPLRVPKEDMRAETPPPTAPLHRYLSLFAVAGAATLFSDGLAEYEATDDGTIFVTLLRAVGALSRKNLPERPGHAGWPSPTPQAQSLGPFAGRFVLMIHGARTPETIHDIECAADDALLPLEGRTLRSALMVPAPFRGLELEGEGLAFSTCKESEEAQFLVVRCVNLLDTEVEGRWRFGFEVREAHRARLDETPLDQLPVSGNELSFRAPPRAILTFLVR